MNIEYRPYIDGLRAIAIFSVVMFHAFPSALPGGFIGVDVFFVISGYLITTIILKDLKKEDFSFLHFYDRRIRRIFPALFLVLIANVLLGWLFLFPSEFKQLGTHLLAGAGFISNFVLWSESGYFDTSSELKPLLHLWSLSIEEQYYIFYPILLVTLWKRTNSLLPFIFLIAGASFFINAYFINRLPVAVFFAPVTRVWELLLGGVLAYLIFSQHNYIKKFICSPFRENICAAIGLGAICSACLLLDRGNLFPGWWALLPTIGTILVIASGSGAWINKNILAAPVLVFIGLISYPLYLWHWSLLSYLSIVYNGSPPFYLRFGAIFLAFVLAYLVYLFIEQPIRKRQWKSVTSSVLIMSICIVAIVGIAVNRGEVTSRLGRSEILVPVFNAMGDWSFPGNGTSIKGAKEKRVIFIGDSFLQQYYSHIKEVVESSKHSLSVKYDSVGGCPPLPNINRIADPGGCVKANDAAYLEAMKPDVGRVVFGSAWHYFYPITNRSKANELSKFEHDTMMYAKADPYKKPIKPGTYEFKAAFADFEALIVGLTNAGKKVYIVLPSPISDEFDPKLMIDRITSEKIVRVGITRSSYRESFAPIISELVRIAEKTNAQLLDPSADLCPQNFCMALLGQKPIYSDNGHIRPYFIGGHSTIFDKIVLDKQ